MPPVAHVHKGMLGIYAGNPLDLLQSIFQTYDRHTGFP